MTNHEVPQVKTEGELTHSSNVSSDHITPPNKLGTRVSRRTALKVLGGSALSLVGIGRSSFVEGAELDGGDPSIDLDAKVSAEVVGEIDIPKEAIEAALNPDFEQLKRLNEAFTWSISTDLTGGQRANDPVYVLNTENGIYANPIEGEGPLPTPDLRAIQILKDNEPWTHKGIVYTPWKGIRSAPDLSSGEEHSFSFTCTGIPVALETFIFDVGDSPDLREMRAKKNIDESALKNPNRIEADILYLQIQSGSEVAVIPAMYAWADPLTGFSQILGFEEIPESTTRFNVDDINQDGDRQWSRADMRQYLKDHLGSSFVNMMFGAQSSFSDKMKVEGYPEWTPDFLFGKEEYSNLSKANEGHFNGIAAFEIMSAKTDGCTFQDLTHNQPLTDFPSISGVLPSWERVHGQKVLSLEEIHSGLLPWGGIMSIKPLLESIIPDDLIPTT